MTTKHYWHRWFAWYPIRTTNTRHWVWLQPVYRRALYKTYSTINDWQRYEYGTIIDVLRAPIKPKHQR